MGVQVWGALAVDRERLRVSVDGAAVRLTGFQLKLLLHLLSHPEQVFSREQLLGAVWGAHDVHPQNVDVAICRLRKALGPCGALIESIRHFGYRFVPTPGVPPPSP
jgi:two-component system phosphate regulon response regulator PhoB